MAMLLATKQCNDKQMKIQTIEVNVSPNKLFKVFKKILHKHHWAKIKANK